MKFCMINGNPHQKDVINFNFRFHGIWRRSQYYYVTAIAERHGWDNLTHLVSFQSSSQRFHLFKIVQFKLLNLLCNKWISIEKLNKKWIRLSVSGFFLCMNFARKIIHSKLTWSLWNWLIKLYKIERNFCIVWPKYQK